MKKLPRHSHLPNELPTTESILGINIVPQMDWLHMAFDSWATFLTQVGAATAAQLTTLLTSWTQMTTALGNIAWNFITKTASDILTTIVNWANIITQFGAWTQAQITTMLTSWAQIVGSLGNLAWSYVTKTASDILTAIASWTNVVTQFGAWTAGQIASVLTSWTQITNGSALGDLVAAIVKVGTGAVTWLSQLISGYGTSDPKLDFTKLSITPYKLSISAFNYVVNGGFEYGTWGGDETQDSTDKVFGIYSAKLETSAANKNTGYSNWIDIRGLNYFTVATYLKGTMTTGNFYFQVFFYNSAKTALSPDHDDALVRSTNINQWTQFSKTYQVAADCPSGTAYIRLRFAWWNGSGNPTGTMRIDGVQLNAGDQIPQFQDFTVYSYNWMPEKIETIATSELSWSSDTYTDILTLNFECESTMLLLIFAYCNCYVQNTSGSDKVSSALFRLYIDTTFVTASHGQLGGHTVASGGLHHSNYSCHSVQVVEKGSHTLKLKMATGELNTTAYAISRRLTILKGFYQGGTT